MNKLRSLGVAVVFLAGCAVGGASAKFVVPPASAQQVAKLTHWEFSCVLLYNEDESKDEEVERTGVTEVANKMGAQGWDMVGSAQHSRSDRNLWCFKRPKM